MVHPNSAVEWTALLFHILDVSCLNLNSCLLPCHFQLNTHILCDVSQCCPGGHQRFRGTYIPPPYLRSMRKKEAASGAWFI